MNVSVTRGDAIVGEIEFRGIEILSPDGSRKIPMAGGQKVPFSHKCRAHTGATTAEIESIAKDIACDLSRNKVVGDAGVFQWRID